MIVTNAAGCGSHLKEAGLDLPVVDISEALAAGRAAGAAAARAAGRLPGVVPPRPRAARARRSRARCCARSPALELVEPAEQELCCGSAGIYNLVQPEAARDARRPQGRRTCSPRSPTSTRAPTRAACSRCRRRCAAPAARPGRAPGRAARRLDPRRAAVAHPALDSGAMATTRMLTGGCLCGGVRFELTEPLAPGELVPLHPLPAAHGRLGLGAGTDRAGVAPHPAGRGAAARLRAPSGGFDKFFCSACGSSMWSRSPADPDVISVRLGAFDGDPGIRPSYRQFVAYAAPWEPTAGRRAASLPRAEALTRRTARS